MGDVSILIRRRVHAGSPRLRRVRAARHGKRAGDDVPAAQAARGDERAQAGRAARHVPLRRHGGLAHAAGVVLPHQPGARAGVAAPLALAAAPRVPRGRAALHRPRCPVARARRCDRGRGCRHGRRTPLARTARRRGLAAQPRVVPPRAARRCPAASRHLPQRSPVLRLLPHDLRRYQRRRGPRARAECRRRALLPYHSPSKSAPVLPRLALLLAQRVLRKRARACSPIRARLRRHAVRQRFPTARAPHVLARVAARRSRLPASRSVCRLVLIFFFFCLNSEHDDKD